MSTSRMSDLLREQGAFCASHGSPLYAALLARLADDVDAGGSAALVLAGHEADPGPSALALRLMGAVHRLVLSGRAPDLAVHYPSVGGDGDGSAAWKPLLRLLETSRETVRALLDRPPQTNEVGRAAALAGCLAHVAAWRHQPLRLVELGASGGLNLRADLFRVEAPDGTGVGPVDSPLVLANAWFGQLPPTAHAVEVVERSGCDTNPIDPLTEDGLLHLASYVWPDMLDRHARLRAAAEVARAAPVTVVRESADTFMRRLRLVPGTTTVVWHSVTWQYLPPAVRAGVEEALDHLGSATDDSTGLARASLEPMRRRPGAEHEFLVHLQTWPEPAGRRLLGAAGPFGPPVTWEAGA